MTEATYAHAECALGSHSREVTDETVTFTCTETGETTTRRRCIAVNTTGSRIGQRCQWGVDEGEGETCAIHSRDRWVCATCQTKVRINQKTGIASHHAGHPYESLDGRHCWACGLKGKKRMGTIGHVWGHEPAPARQAYQTVRG